jgi:hypothetical protein
VLPDRSRRPHAPGWGAISAARALHRGATAASRSSAAPSYDTSRTSASSSDSHRISAVLFRPTARLKPWMSDYGPEWSRSHSGLATRVRGDPPVGVPRERRKDRVTAEGGLHAPRHHSRSHSSASSGSRPTANGSSTTRGARTPGQLKMRQIATPLAPMSRGIDLVRSCARLDPASFVHPMPHPGMPGELRCDVSNREGSSSRSRSRHTDQWRV